MRPALVGIGVCAALGIVREVAAQRFPSECLAPSLGAQAGNLWPELRYVYRADPDSTSEALLGAKLTGLYDLVAVTTEGSGAVKTAEIGRLHLTYRPDSSPGQVGRPNEPFWGDARYSYSGRLDRPLGKSDAVTIWKGVYRAPDVLQFRETDSAGAMALRLDDPWPIYYVTSIDSSGSVVGRWESGGYVIVPRETPAGTLVEHQSGYFCLQPRR